MRVGGTQTKWRERFTNIRGKIAARGIGQRRAGGHVTDPQGGIRKALADTIQENFAETQEEANLD